MYCLAQGNTKRVERFCLLKRKCHAASASLGDAVAASIIRNELIAAIESELRHEIILWSVWNGEHIG